MTITTRILAAATLLLVGCAPAQSPMNAPISVTIVDVFENVHWYPACATSPIELGGGPLLSASYGASTR